jgi:hypothetical protein
MKLLFGLWKLGYSQHLLPDSALIQKERLWRRSWQDVP